MTQGSLFYDLLVHARAVVESQIEISYEPFGPELCTMEEVK